MIVGTKKKWGFVLFSSLSINGLLAPGFHSRTYKVLPTGVVCIFMCVQLIYTESYGPTMLYGFTFSKCIVRRK